MERNIEEVKKELLVLAKRFNDFCTERGIHYSVHGGTMLGAVREKGFIAWDDDMDVTFTRPEYEAFIKAFEEGPIEDTVMNNNGSYPRLIMRREGHPIVWTDIFVYDYITENPFLRKVKLTRLKLMNLEFRNPETLKYTKENSRGNALRYAVISAIVKHGNRTDRKKLQKKAHRIMTSLQGSKKTLCRTNDTIVGMPKLVPGYAMDKYEMIPFEDIELMITSNWHEVLVSSYGEDYMTPRKTAIEDQHDSFVDREIKNAEEEFERQKR